MKKLPLWAVLLLDVLVTGVCLCVFSLFHHVLPRVIETPPVDISRPGTTGTTGTGGTTSAELPAQTGWAKKWPDKFSAQTVITENSYRSAQVSVAMETVSENGITYCVADIYVNSIDNLRTAFAKDQYGKGIRDSMPAIAKNNKAIVAVNGDYYGNRDTGTVIRNGKLYRSTAFQDVCVLYYDGTMETFTSDEFDVNKAIAKGAYQSWAFGPKLLHADGTAMTAFNTGVGGANPRTAIGYYEPGHYCLVLVDGRQPGYSSGMNMTALSQLFASLGCKQAYNFDGGQSSMMTFQDKIYNRPYNGGRSASDIFYIGEVE